MACVMLALMHVAAAAPADQREVDNPPSPDVDFVRAFRIAPGWQALEAYVSSFKERQPAPPLEGPWPSDAALEQMKAHLALGLTGPRPPPYADWTSLKRQAAQDVDVSAASLQLWEQHVELSKEDWGRQVRMLQVAHALQQAVGTSGQPNDDYTAAGGARTIQLVRALELPRVRPSLFRRDADLAPPGAGAEEVSGRFGIVFRQIVTPRHPISDPVQSTDGAGLYDMLTRTESLVRPVQQVRLFRDGRLTSTPSRLRVTETLWRDVDGPECEGWTPGFGAGDADAETWQHFESLGEAGTRRLPTGSLYGFLTTMTLPRMKAARTRTTVRLNRDDTGFVGGTHLHYDLDGDGIPDLSIFEGQGRGPGHLDGPTLSDDRWYRLAFVNIDGAWKVLGVDTFGYGCGC